jgi:hypothetical protein
MSKGLGRIERHIQDKIKARRKASVLISSRQVLDVFQPSSVRPSNVIDIFGASSWLDWEPSRAQRLSAVRAMHSFVRKYPRYALLGGQGQKLLFLYDTTDTRSVRWAQASVLSKWSVPLRSVNRVLKSLEKNTPRAL